MKHGWEKNRVEKSTMTDHNTEEKESPWMRYDIKIKRFGTRFEIREYEDTQFKLKPGQTLGIKRNVAERSKEGVFRLDSLMRTWQIMSDVAEANDTVWKSFITLTFAENITDLNEANKRFHVYVVQMARRCKDFGFEFQYIGVPEFQKRGAVHYHLVTNVQLGKVYEHTYITAVKKIQRKRVGTIIPRRKRIWTNTRSKEEKARLITKGEGIRYIDYYDIPYWPEKANGFSSAFGFDAVDEKFTVVGYLAKYFFKGYNELKKALVSDGDLSDLDLRLFGRIKILVSRNLEPVKLQHLDLRKLCPYFLDYIKSTGICYHSSKKRSESKHIPSLKIEKYSIAN